MPNNDNNSAVILDDISMPEILVESTPLWQYITPTLISPVSITNSVVIGATSLIGNERLRVAGNIKSNGITLNTGVTATSISDDTTLSNNSASTIPTVHAVKTYIDAIGGVKAGDNVSLFTNDANYISTETDPIFNASPARGITSTDINNWNSSHGSTWKPSNYALLETYTQTNSNIADAVTKKHSHTNLSSLNNIKSNGTSTEFLAGDGVYRTVTTTENEPLFKASAAYSITSGNIVNWNTAYTNNHTHSNKSLLDTYSNLNSSITTAISQSHTHTNKTVLDGISNTEGSTKFLAGDGTYKSIETAGEPLFTASPAYNITNANITNWGTAYTNNHTHSNKSTLDTYTFSNANVLSTIANSHTHSNLSNLEALIFNGDGSKALMNNGAYATVLTSAAFTDFNTVAAITSTNVGNWNSTFSNSHTHSNKDLLDTYTQTNSNIADAVTKKHSHANNTLLDTLTSSGDGASFLANDGTYKASTAIPGGSNTQIQYNDNGLFGGNSSFTYNSSTTKLSVPTVVATTVEKDTVSIGLSSSGVAINSDLNITGDYKSNGSKIDKTYIGLGSVTNDAQVKISDKGAANGVASLDSSSKIPIDQLPLTAMIYKGTWNANTNTPTLADGTGTNGWFYRVATAGTQNLGSGSITFSVGDGVIYNGSIWQRSGTSESVTSVAGKTGVVTLTSSDVGLGNVPNLDTTNAVNNQHVHTSDILSWDNTSKTYKPHTSKSAGKFDSDAVAPSNTTRLNYDGYFYASKLISSNDVEGVYVNATTGFKVNGTTLTYSHVGAEPANANIQTHISSVSNPHSTTASQVGAEPTLGNPLTNGYVLSSTTGGVRSWVQMTSGSTPTDGILKWDSTNNYYKPYATRTEVGTDLKFYGTSDLPNTLTTGFLTLNGSFRAGSTNTNSTIDEGIIGYSGKALGSGVRGLAYGFGGNGVFGDGGSASGTNGVLGVGFNGVKGYNNLGSASTSRAIYGQNDGSGYGGYFATKSGSKICGFDCNGTLVSFIDNSGNYNGGIITPTKTPTSAADTGAAGTITWDANYIYVCIATNTWKRVTISTW